MEVLLKNLDFHLSYNSSPKYDVSKNYRLNQFLFGMNYLNAAKKSGLDSSFYNNYNFISSQYIAMASYSYNSVRLTYNGQRSRATKALRQRYNESKFSVAGYFAAPHWSQDSADYRFYANQLQLTYLKSQTNYWNFYSGGQEMEFYLRYGFALNLNGYYLQNALSGSIEKHYFERTTENLPFFGGMNFKLFLQLQIGNDRFREKGNLTVFANLNLLFLEQNRRYIAAFDNQPINIQYNLPFGVIKNYSKTMYTRHTPID